MNLNPPAGSAISVSYDEGDPVVTIPAKGSVSRYFGGLFLLCWLGGWAFGFSAVSSQLLAGKGNLFMVVWLGAWTVGGVLAILTAYRIFRPGVPETLQLQRGSVLYDSGIPPFELNGFSNKQSRGDYWNSIWPKRTRVDLNRQQLQTMRLRETEAGNRLTVDLGTQRIEMASQASEVEREWLAGLLATRYALTQARSGATIEDHR
jgi:hypothetical protein